MTAEYLRSWGRYATSSPLYTHLVDVVADDADLLGLMNEIEHTPKPNIFFAAVHYLLMSGEPGAELARFYPSLTSTPRPPLGVEMAFRPFCLEHREQIVSIGATRFTQTNECRRCVALLPMIWAGALERFHLLDLGASAGLNLALDHFSYRWDGLEWGSGSLELVTDLRSGMPVPAPVSVLSRTGLDLHPIDPGMETDRRWLDALIWPEHHDRRARLRAALETLSSLDYEIIGGDAVETLPDALEALPGDEPVVVMSSFVMIQLSADQRSAIERIVDDTRQKRPLLRVSMEAEIEDDPWASLMIDDGDGWRTIGRAQHHGEWLELT